ncbi:Uncharacterised protein [Salmonella enterica subsp. enterica serovar Bovismorbificans]|uniref:Uncharacterized protein n=1 Tax=Salmonella enterica subsp. enterica serovar Bovismorbificans TaxID=58097 RepID=A0A655C5G0_SALET|nr:Uncharacterised protein [Salmonella enterica subsp. enterica serovar Bovismorbificans]
MNVHHDSRRLIRPCAEPAIFRPLFDGGDIAQPYRRAVLIRDDKLAVFVGRLHLIVSRKRHRSFGAIQTAFRRVDVGAGNCGTDSFAGQTERGDSLSIQFYTHRRALPAGKRHQPDAGDLRDLLRHAGFYHVLYMGHRHRI